MMQFRYIQIIDKEDQNEHFMVGFMIKVWRFSIGSTLFWTPEGNILQNFVWCFFISSLKNLQSTIVTTQLKKYSIILRRRCHEEQGVLSTPWHEEGKGHSKTI